MSSSKIEWTDAVWNCIVGCSRVSAGCERCYAEGVAHRGMQEAHRGLTVMGAKGPRWNGTVRFLADRLATPLRWRKPRRVFVNSMSDLFHPGVTDEQIAAVFGVMAACPQHTFQVLTKRPERMVEWFEWYEGDSGTGAWPEAAVIEARSVLAGVGMPHVREALGRARYDWPLPNVWLGVSCENQVAADTRIPLLLQCPAAVRWVSAEPLLGPIALNRVDFLPPMRDPGPHDPAVYLDALRGHVVGPDEPHDTRIDWVVVGGESGNGARPCDLAWVRSIVAQCREAQVPCFVKQLGACASDPKNGLAGRHLRVPQEAAPLVSKRLKNGKGGDPEEWPPDLRVRQWPEASHAS